MTSTTNNIAKGNCSRNINSSPQYHLAVAMNEQQLLPPKYCPWFRRDTSTSPSACTTRNTHARLDTLLWTNQRLTILFSSRTSNNLRRRLNYRLDSARHGATLQKVHTASRVSLHNKTTTPFISKPFMLQILKQKSKSQFNVNTTLSLSFPPLNAVLFHVRHVPV